MLFRIPIKQVHISFTISLRFRTMLFRIPIKLKECKGKNVTSFRTMLFRIPINFEIRFYDSKRSGGNPR